MKKKFAIYLFEKVFVYRIHKDKPLTTLANNLMKHFSREVQMANKHFKKCYYSLGKYK